MGVGQTLVINTDEFVRAQSRKRSAEDDASALAAGPAERAQEQANGKPSKDRNQRFQNQMSRRAKSGEIRRLQDSASPVQTINRLASDTKPAIVCPMKP